MNKVYRIIWNSSLGQWVVTSELGRGKTKTKTNKKTVALTLASLLSAVALPALAWSGTATCDVSNICTLNNSVWDYSQVNHGAGALTIDDGGTYTVNGPTSIKTSGTAGPSYTNINIKDAYANGWAIGIGAAAGIDPATLNGYMNFKASEREVITVTNAAGIVTSVSVYPGSALFNTNQATDVVSSIPNAGPVTFFYDAGMVKVSDGIANVSVAATTINPISRNTNLALADGTGSGLAKIVWRSNNTFHPTNLSSNFPDSSNPVTGTKGVNYTTFVGTFTAYDGSTKTVTDADSFKVYLDWLAEEVKASRITSQSVYNTEQSKAYKTGAYNYSYSISSSGASIAPELGTGRLGDSLLKGQGSNASVEVADGVVLTHSNGSSMAGVMDLGVNSVAPGSQSEYGMIVVTDSAQGINNGTIRSVNSGNLTTILVNKNAAFTNNNLIEVGSTGDYNNMSRYAIAVWKKGLFKNTGTINTYSYKSSINNFGAIVYVRGAARFENSGSINFAAYEKNTSGSNYDAFRGIVLNESDSTFLNDTSGVINLGINPTDGSSVGVGVSSGLVLFSSAAKNYIASENRGTINIGQKVQGTNVFWGNAASGSLNFTNSGTINLDGNRDGTGKEIDSIIANVGIFRNGNPGGYVADMFHTGTINVQGYGNIALKALTAGKLSSSGTVNVYGNDTTRGFFNYGAWAEGNGSVISFTGGNVNLLGDNTVGVYAGDLGKIALSGDSAVNFSNGTNQIGYYIYGAGSSITNTSTGQQDVSTAGSTLMRIAGGASLSGVGGATMSASGKGSAIIVGSDAGTTVSSGGMSLNVNGLNAVGIKVEGGAVGNINNTTTINLSGQGAIAGIADGQGHKLDGSNNGEINNATILTAAANLSSSLNGVTGYIAQNQANLINSGNITFTGDNAEGIRVAEGAKGSNSGNIILDGAGSVGLTANANIYQTTLSSTGNITLNGSWDGSDDLTRTIGILADGNKVAVTMGDGNHSASVNMNGAGSVGVYATDGSTVTLKDKVAVNFDTTQSDQVAFWVDGAGSNIITEAGSTLTQVIGDGATLFNVTGGATFSGELNLKLSGQAGSDKITSGIRVSGSGSEATLGASSQVTVGTNATGVLAESGGKAVIEQNVTFSVTGSNAVVGKSTGSGAKVENHASVTSGVGSSGSTAFLAQNGGSIDNQGQINLSSGSGHTAIDVDNGHVTNTGNISANGTAIHITGSGSTINNSGVITAVDGKAAIHVDAGAELDLSAVSGSGTIVAKGSADGILLDTGAVSLNVANTVIDMSDVTSSGIGIHNVAGIGGIKLDNTHIKVGGTGIGIKTGASLAKANSGIIDVTDGTGILYRNEDGSAVASDLDFSDSSALTINVAGNGIGVLATLDGHNRAVNTGASVNILNAAGGSAIDVTGAKSVTNSGHLISQSTVADGNVLNVHDAGTINNSGTIAASSADIAAIAMSNTGDKTFSNTGNITGLLDFTSGNNLINLAGGTLTGSVKSHGGSNTLTASGGSIQRGAIELVGDRVQTVNVSDAATVGDVILTGNAAHQVTLTDGAVASNLTFGDGNNSLSINDGQADDVVMGSGNNALALAAGILGNITLGDGDNSLILNGTSTAGTTTLGLGDNTLSLSNSATLSGTLSTGGKTSLTLADSAHIDSFIGADGSENSVVIKDSATFGTLDAGLGGTNDSLSFDGADYRLINTADIQHFDRLNLTQGSSFTTAQQIQMGNTALSVGKITIDGSSSLIFNPVSAYTLNHALSGTGLIDVQSGISFDFGAGADNQFAGLVQMNSTGFALSGFNTTALSNSVLSVMEHNTTTVGSGSQSIGGLIFNGGTVDFGVSLPNASNSDNRIQAAVLNASGTGNVQINYNGFDNGAIPQVNHTLGLLDQQTHTLIQLVGATRVAGEAGNLALIDGQGDAITDATTTVIKQGANDAANAYYDYRLTTYDNNGNANGLYVSYGLTQLNLLSSGANQLVINTANSVQKALSAKVTGSGDLGIIAGNGANAFTISNLSNSYIGATDLKSGTLIVGTDNALGHTSALKLASGTTTDLNGKAQTIGALNGAVGSTFNLNNGSLTLNDGGMSLGDLAGRGQLTIASGILTVASANTGLTTDTLVTVNDGAEALLQDINALGSSLIVADGRLTLDHINGTFTNQLSGSGQLASHNGSNIRLSANNTGFNGVMDIDSLSVLTISSTDNLGSAAKVQNANRFIVDNAAAMSLAAVVSGSGELVKTSAGTLTLSGINTYSGKTDIQSGIVAISTDANLGNASTTNQTQLNGGDLQITADLVSDRDVILAQSGRVIVDSGKTATMNGWDDLNNSVSTFTKAGDGTLVWSGNNSANTAGVNVARGTLQVSHLNQLASALGVVNLEAQGRLSLLQTIASDTDFTRQLSGSGELWVNLADKAQAFSLNASTAGGDFTGLVTLDAGQFVLNSDADNTLRLATLRLNSQGSTKLNGAHAIGGLTMNGGQIEVDYSPIDFRSEGSLTVSLLDATGGGNLAISTPGNLPNLLPETGASLFDQDDNAGDRIVIASTVKGTGSQLAVTKQDGTPVAPDTVIELTQDTTPGSHAVGNAHYNYFGAVKSDGLYLGYGLTQLDAFAGQSIILDNSNATDNALGAKLTGDGGFTVNATNTVRIGNAASDYTGVTQINSGKVELITNNALGQTSQLAMLSGTVMDVSGNSQTVGSLATQSGSLIDLNQGLLNITHGGQVDGKLTGSGQLTLSGGTLVLTQNNSLLMAGIDIHNGTTAELSKPQGLGQGLITNNGILHLNSAKGTLLNSLKGSGETLLTNSAEMTLGGDGSDYTGTFTTTAGTTLTVTDGVQLGSGVINNSGRLVADTEGRWALTNSLSGSGTLVKRGSGTVVVDGNNLSAGLTDIENGLLLLGETPTGNRLNRVASAAPATLLSDVIIRQSGALGGYGTVTGNVSNGGALIMGNAATGNGDGIFTIDGHYHGDNGVVIFNTQLADDSSSTDRLVITGNSTGQSSVMVASARGEGALTRDGIKLIDVRGSSIGQFALSGRAIAGAYEYFLYQGAISTPDDGDWYLRSALSSDNPDPSIYRPEAGGYMANMAAAGNLFTLRLADREGRAENSSIWLRQTGSRNKHRDSTGQLRTETNSYVVQGGGEVFGRDVADTGRFGLGLMAAYGKADSKSNSRTTGYKANSTVDGYSTGLYGTWYQDAKTLNAAYVDSWVQYSWLDAEVNGQEVAKESYDMDGFSASVEAGYRLPVYQGLNGEVFVTPQAQITWNGIKADDHTETNGTRVSSSGNDNVQTRLGVKVSRDGVSDKDKGTDKLFTTYAEVNWLYNSQQYGAVMDGVEVKQGGSRHLGELKLGAEGQLNQHINLWANVGQQLGNEGYSDTSVNLGVKYRF